MALVFLLAIFWGGPLVLMELASSLPDWHVWDVYTVDQRHGWAGGTAGVFHTSDGGAHWIQVMPAQGRGPQRLANKRTLGRILFASTERAIVRVANGLAVVTPGSGIVELRVPPLDQWRNLQDVVLTDELHGWAAGGLAPDQQSGVRRLVDETSQDSLSDAGACTDRPLYATDDGGRTWNEVGTLNCLIYMTPVSSQVVWLATRHHVLTTNDRGRNWSVRPIRVWAPSILFADDDHVYLDGNNEAPQTNDDVITWLRLPVQQPDVLFSDAMEVWGIRPTTDEDSGTVVHSCDGGRTWRAVQGLTVPRHGVLHAKISGEVWISAAAQGSVFHVSQHGKGWQRQQIASPPLYRTVIQRSVDILGRFLRLIFPVG